MATAGTERSQPVLLQTAEPGDDTGEKDHGKVTGIDLDPGVLQRRHLILGGGQPHRTLLMPPSFGIDVTTRQSERELGRLT